MSLGDKLRAQINAKKGETIADKYGMSYDQITANKYNIDKLNTNELFTLGRKNINRFKPYFKSEELFKLFSDSVLGFTQLFKDKTGAAGHHHNFIGGLLVHTYEMLDILYDTYVMHPKNAMKFNTTTKPDNIKFDFSIAATAILYHDWGKLKEYKHDAGQDERGRFATTYDMMIKGHIFMSTEQFDRDADKYGIDDWIKDKVTHCILAHHSKLDWGSPVKPITPEARMVCACDLISADRAKGKGSYFYDFVKGNIMMGNQEDYYNDVIAPRMEREKFKDSIKRGIDKTDMWDELEDPIKRRKEEIKKSKTNENIDLRSYIKTTMNEGIE